MCMIMGAQNSEKNSVLPWVATWLSHSLSVGFLPHALSIGHASITIGVINIPVVQVIAAIVAPTTVMILTNMCSTIHPACS